jgi:hypothetical protein
MRKLTIVAALIAVGCTKLAPSAPVAAQAAAAQTSPTAFEAPKPSQVVAGRVVEKLESGPYSLLRLVTPAGEAWAAVPHTDKKVGEEVRVVDPLPVKQFEAKPLERTFELVYVGNLG